MKNLNAIVAYKMLEMVKALLDEWGEASFNEAPGSADACTYKSTQATKCAVCGQHKHTPLRNDTMGGYVCLTCIDQELERLHHRLHWLHDCSTGQTDHEGYEWGIYRVKWENGQAVSVLQTNSDLSDLDAEMAREQNDRTEPRA